MRQKMANGGLVIANRKENEKGRYYESHSPLLNSHRKDQIGTMNGRVKITVEDETGVKTQTYYPAGTPSPSPINTPNNTPRGTPLAAKRMNGDPYSQTNDNHQAGVIKKVLNDPYSYHSVKQQPVIYATPYIVGGNNDNNVDISPSSPTMRTKDISKVKLPDGGELYRIRSLKSGEEIRPHLNLSPHEHELRRFSNPTVVLLDKEDIEASKLSIYDNVRYVFTEY